MASVISATDTNADVEASSYVPSQNSRSQSGAFASPESQAGEDAVQRANRRKLTHKIRTAFAEVSHATAEMARTARRVTLEFELGEHTGDAASKMGSRANTISNASSPRSRMTNPSKTASRANFGGSHCSSSPRSQNTDLTIETVPPLGAPGGAGSRRHSQRSMKSLQSVPESHCSGCRDDPPPARHIMVERIDGPRRQTSMVSMMSVRSTLSKATTATKAKVEFARVQTLEFEIAENHTDNRGRCGFVVYAMMLSVLLIGVPSSMALRVVGYKAATGDASQSHSVMAPLIIGSLVLAFASCVLLLVICGKSSFAELARPRYFILLLPAFLNAGIFIFGNMSLDAGLSGTDLRLIMKVGIALNVIGEVWITKKFPYATQLLTIVALMISVLIFSFDGDGNDQQRSVVAWILGLASAVSTTLFSCVYEGVARSFNQVAQKSGECLRLVIALEMWKVLVQILTMCAVEPEFLSFDRLFEGWDAEFLFGAVAPTPVQLVFCNTAIIVVGALRQQIVAALDLPITYVLEALAFGNVVEVEKCLLIAVITLMVMTYMAFNIEIRRAVAKEMEQGTEKGDENNNNRSQVPTLEEVSESSGTV